MGEIETTGFPSPIFPRGGDFTRQLQSDFERDLYAIVPTVSAEAAATEA